MKTASTSLQTNLYQQNIHAVADLYTFTFASGVQRWTTHDADVTYGGNTWSCSGPGIERAGCGSSAGFEVGKLKMTINPGSAQLNGEGMVRACLDRHFDDVPVLFERAFLDLSGTVIGTLRLFEGRAFAQPSSTAIEVEVRSAVDKLRRNFPPRVLQLGCPWAVYDTNCTANPASFTHARTAATGSTAKVVRLSSTSSMAVPGSKIRFTSGALNGQLRTVISVSGVDVTVQLPFTVAPTAGDGCDVIRGCDKTRPTCRDTFANVAHFGGFPDAPSLAVYDPWWREPAGYTGPRLATRYGDPIPVVYGQARVTGVPVYMGEPVRDVQVWGSVDIPSSEFNMLHPGATATVVIAICEAPISSIGAVWCDGVRIEGSSFVGSAWNQSNQARRLVQYKWDPVTLWPVPDDHSAEHDTPIFISGSSPVAFPYMDARDADANGTTWAPTAQMRANALTLRDGKIPKLEYYVYGRCWDAGLQGANPADVVVDVLTDARFGFGLTTGEVEVNLGSNGLTQSGYRTYCTAMGFKVNRAITSKQEAAKLLEELMQSTNSEGVWSEGKLKIIPWGDTAIGSFVPPSTSILLDENELGRQGNEDPIEVERTPDEEVFNEWPIALYDSSLGEFNESAYAYLDEAHQADHGTRTAEPVRNEWISIPSQAYRVSQFLALKSINLRGTYKFDLGLRWGQLDPLDYVTVRESITGVDTLCRIKSIEESGRGRDARLRVEAYEWPLGVATAIDLTPQTHDGWTGPVPVIPDLTGWERAAAFWTPAANMPGSAAHYGLAYDPVADILVAVGASAASYSLNGGSSWVAATGVPAFTFRSVAWSPSLGLFCAVGDSGACMTSPTGAVWTNRSGSNTGGASVTWSATLGLFVAVGTNACATSPTGTTWTTRTIGTGAWQAVVDAGGRLVAVGSNVAAFSTNATSWTAAATPPGDCLTLAWDGILLIAGATSRNVYGSSDGDVWRIGTIPAPSRFDPNGWSQSITHAGEGIFVAVGAEVPGIRCATLQGARLSDPAHGAVTTIGRFTYRTELPVLAPQAVLRVGHRLVVVGTTYSVSAPA